MHATQANAGFFKRAFVQPVQRFIHMEASGGILLLLCAVTAIIWANSPFSAAYFHLWETHIMLEIGHSAISMHLMHWINDALMAIFFFMVGLEIKREMLTGALASPKKAALPIAGAIGGMIVPALFYALFNAGTPSAGGWGIPMATDIAFALGVVILLGKRVPLGLKVFLTALAIVDDLGAVLVIAFFYTADLSLVSLGIGAAFLAALVAVNRMGVRRPAPYIILGIGLWVALLQSGIHATIAGVLLALTIPSGRKLGAYGFMALSQDLARQYAGHTQPNQREPNAEQEHVVHHLEQAIKDVSSPMVRIAHALHGWVNFLIMPLFAFANAGVRFVGTDITAALTSTVTIGVVLGLFLGKQIGVSLFSWLSVRLGLAEMPAGATWRQFYGVSLLAGIGFTMSLFVSNLAFTEAAMLDSAKMGILLASAIAGVAGWIVLSRAASTVSVPTTTTIATPAPAPAYARLEPASSGIEQPAPRVAAEAPRETVYTNA